MRYSAFADHEKEPFGRNDYTLFVFDLDTDVTGNVADVKAVHQESDPEFTIDQIVRLAKRLDVDRVYLGARRTEVPYALIATFMGRGLAITFETADLEIAKCAHAEFGGGRLTVVYRVDHRAKASVGHNNGFITKIDDGSGVLEFRYEMPLWTDNTEVSPSSLRGLFNRMGR